MKLGAYTACLHDRPLPETLKILAGLGLNTLLFALFRGQAGLDVLLSQLLAILVVLPFNYQDSKLWSFR